MKVLILSQYFSPEPVHVPTTLARGLADRGHEVEVVTALPNYPSGRIYEAYRRRIFASDGADGVRVHRLPLYPSHDATLVRRLGTYGSFSASAAVLGTLLTRRQDVTYVYHPPPTVGLAALLWKVLRRAPYVYHVQDLWPEAVTESGMLPSSRLATAATGMLLRWCDLLYRHAFSVAVISPGFRHHLLDRGVPAAKVATVYNWTDESRFLRPVAEAAAGPSPGNDAPFTVLYAGNLGEYQDLEPAVRAVSALHGELPRLRLRLIGDGPMAPRLRHLAGSLGSQNVDFLGYGPAAAVAEAMQEAEVLLVSLKALPFLTRTIPSKLQASLAAGRPVLLAAAGDAATLVRAAGAGLVTRPGDPDGLASSLRQLYAMPPGRRAELGAAGRRFYEQELSEKAGVARLESMLREAAGSRPTGRRK